MPPTTNATSPISPTLASPVTDILQPFIGTCLNNEKDTSSIACELVDDIIDFLTVNQEYLKPPSSSSARTMRRVVTELSERHEILFGGIMKRLEPCENNVSRIFIEVTEEMFKDGTFNWGRLVTMYAFAGCLAKYLRFKGNRDCKNIVSSITKEYVTKKHIHNIEKLGGWGAFESYFPAPGETESKIWKGLLVTAMGLGALATLRVAVR